ncbi:MAG: DUF3142 domain-containing protein [Opitutaceae bacterium]
MHPTYGLKFCRGADDNFVVLKVLATFFLFNAANAGGAGTREVYVWQRQFGTEVVAALQAFQPQIDGCCVLAAEVSWVGGRAHVVRPAIDFRALVAVNKPVGLALRIGAFSGAFARDDATAIALGELAADLLVTAERAGLTVAELQIDFDAAESKLAGYREWLVALRAQVGATRLVFTALPAWLRHAEFRALAREADGFVLQVHSLERPAAREAAFALCDPVRALEWARQASGVAVPFRVALPTYGYLLAFDAGGKFIGLSAEGPRRAWPRGTDLRAIRADAPTMARLAQALDAATLPNYTGAIWFRLPVASDRLNWDAVTLAAVLRGEVPQKRVEVESVRVEAGLVEIVVANRGTTTETLPAAVTARWPDEARPLATDGLGGFFLETRGGEAQAVVRAANVPADAFIAPGRKVKIAWLRFAHDVSLEVSIPTPP